MGFGRSTTFAFIGEDKFSPVASKVSREAGGMGGKIGGAFGKIGKFGKAAAIGVGAVAAGAGLAAAAGVKMVKVAEEQGTASARLAQVMKSMGYEENAAAADKYADSLEQVIAVDSAEIKAAQAKLATFSDIAESQKLMARTTRLAADMAAGGWGDMAGASVGLGKALQDPIAGMSLLSEQGSLTKDEQKAIAAEFERTGDKAAAQDSILKALEKQVGGVAEATADSSVKMGLAWGEVTEAVGKKLQPAFDKLVPIVQKAADWFINKLMPGLGEIGKKVMPVLKSAFDQVKGAIEKNRPGLEKLGKIFKAVGEFVLNTLVPIFAKTFGQAISAVITAIGWIGDVVAKIGPPILRGIATIIRGFASFHSFVTGVLEGILTVAEKTLGWIPGIGDKIKGAKEAFASWRDDSKSKLSSIASGLDQLATKVELVGIKSRSDDSAIKIKDNIAEKKERIAELKAKLDDPNLTKDRRVEIKAEIADARAGVREAKAELASLKDKTIYVNVRTRYSSTYEKNAGGAGRGLLTGQATGGLVSGPGTSTSDSIPRWLSNGEYVLRASAVKRYGVAMLDAMNEGRSASVSVPRSTGGGGPSVVDVHLHLDGREIQRSLVDLQRRTGRLPLTA